MVTIIEIRYIHSFGYIRLDSGEEFWLRQEDLHAAGFHEGAEYNKDFFLHQIRLLQYPHALNHAVSMLSRRPCSKNEITSRLTRLMYTAEVTELVVYKLEKEKLLNDADFCEQWTRFRISRHMGPSVICRELRMKGISEDIISAALNHINQDEEYENAVFLARKAWNRIRSGGDIRKNRQKVILSLVRKGYDWDTARSACEYSEETKE